MRIRLLFLLLSIALPAYANFTQDVELSRVTKQIKQLQKNISYDHQQQENLQQELEKTETTLSQLNQQINLFNKAISDEQKKINQLKRSQQTILTRLSVQHGALDQQISAAYQLSQLQSVKIIFNQTNPNTIQRHLAYYQYLTKERMQLIDSIKASLSTLNSTLHDITTHQQNIKKILVEKKSQQQQQKSAQSHRKNLLSELKQSVQSKEQKLTTLVANQKALREVINHLQVQVKTDTTISGLPFNQLRGKLHWPLQGTMIATYGSPLDVGDQRLNGVIIKAQQGTPIHAVYSGRVIFANWLRGFGLLIIINHGNNFMSLYGRNDTVLTRVGAHVSTGDVIATTGNSGGFDKTSLYFEIRKNGSPINPNIWCR